MTSEITKTKTELYQKISFNIPVAYLDDILDYLESKYALFPMTKECFGIGNDNEKVCQSCQDFKDCQEEAEARAEHYYMVG